MNKQEQNQTNQHQEQEEGLTRQDIEAQIITKTWKDEAYKQELLANPKVLIEQAFGVEFDQEVTVQVLEENPTSLHFVLPMSPMQIANRLSEITNELSEEELEEIAGGVKGAHRRHRAKGFGIGLGSNFLVGFGTAFVAGRAL